MKYIKYMKYMDIILNTIISAMIGCIVGVVAIIMNPGMDILNVLISNSMVGVVVGTISSYAYYYIYEKKRLGIKAVLWTIFIIVFVIMLILALLQSRDGFPWDMLIIFIPIVECLSLSYCYATYRISLKYNEKLLHKKEQILNKK